VLWIVIRKKGVLSESRQFQVQEEILLVGKSNSICGHNFSTSRNRSLSRQKHRFHHVINAEVLTVKFNQKPCHHLHDPGPLGADARIDNHSGTADAACFSRSRV
jgi:hypothetical protein